ncbi:MAG: phytanoyl-CoA dioxygenase family protein [Candidatus Latescibacterota bacterium]|nr:phytanoyl-CoA dioxygenase family protein [Candidatus Latescibacterota bacterium]
MKLTFDQIAEYLRHGVLRVEGALEEEDLQPVIDELKQIIDDQANELHAEGKIVDLAVDEPFERRYGILYGQSQEISRGLDIMHYRGAAIFAFLRNDNLLDTLESLLGSEITCNPIQHLRAKPPARYDPASEPNFHNAPWHQDAGVMMAEAEGSEIITCWLPLGDATAEMGCMEVISGQREGGYLRHQKEGGTTIASELMPAKKPVVMDCRKGDVVLMDRFTPHRSRPNKSDKCRWSLDLRYQPRGQHTGRTGHPDFVARSAAEPVSVLSDHQQWCDLWVDAMENPRGFVGHRSE